MRGIAGMRRPRPGARPGGMGSREAKAAILSRAAWIEGGLSGLTEGALSGAPPPHSAALAPPIGGWQHAATRASIPPARSRGAASTAPESIGRGRGAGRGRAARSGLLALVLVVVVVVK